MVQHWLHDFYMISAAILQLSKGSLKDLVDPEKRSSSAVSNGAEDACIYDARSPQISNKYQIHITLSLPWWMIFIIWWIYWILLTIIEYYWILILDDTGSDLLILICSLTFVLSFHFLQFLDLDCKKTCPNCPIMAWGDSLESSCLALRIKGLVCASPSVPAWHGKDPQHKIIPYPSDHRCRAARDAASGLVSQM